MKWYTISYQKNNKKKKVDDMTLMMSLTVKTISPIAYLFAFAFDLCHNRCANGKQMFICKKRKYKQSIKSINFANGWHADRQFTTNRTGRGHPLCAVCRVPCPRLGCRDAEGRPGCRSFGIGVVGGRTAEISQPARRLHSQCKQVCHNSTMTDVSMPAGQLITEPNTCFEQTWPTCCGDLT